MFGKDSRFVEGMALGLWQANCYLLGDLELGTAVVVDPGQDAAAPVRERLAARDVRCEAILLTHGHLDHLWSVPELARDLDVPVLLHPEDRYLWDDPASAFGDLPPDVLAEQFGLVWDPPTEHLETFRDGQRLTFAGMTLVARHTPGHTPGSSVFLLTGAGSAAAASGGGAEADGLAVPLLLSGDLIFKGSVGRTDFPRGSWEQEMASIRRVVLPLEDGTVVLSGHGPETTVGAERASNPFLREIAHR